MSRTLSFMGWRILLVFSLAGVSSSYGDQVRYAWFETRQNLVTSASAEIVNRLKSTGLDGVVVPAVVDGRSWYPSQLLPGPATTTENLKLTRFFHVNGLGLAVYFQTFIHGGNPNESNQLIKTHPDWLSSDWRGVSMETLISGTIAEPSTLDGYFLDPGLPRTKEFLLALIIEAVQVLQPDWVILDHVRYPIPSPWAKRDLPHGQPYGFHPVPRKAFEADYGVDPAVFIHDASKSVTALGEEEANRLRRDWDRRRADEINTFIRSVQSQLRSNHPSCRFAVVGYPDPVQAREELFQDWPRWIREGLVDAVILPDNAADRSTTEVLGLLSSDLRGKIWISCSTNVPGNGMESRLRSISGQPGVILFGGPGIDSSRERATVKTTPPAAWQPTPPQEALSLPPIESEEAPQEAESSGTSWPVLNEREPAVLMAKAEFPPGQIRALYAFQPDSSPFSGLTPNQIALKVKDLGFNAVFGGSSSPAIRRALQIAGIKRFAEIPLFVGEKHWQRDPGCQPVARSGRKVKKQGWYAPVCPNTEWLRKEKLETILRLVRDQDIDGVWLDFIRYPVFWEEVPPFLVDTCFCPVCLAKFEQKTGLRPVGNSTQEKAEWILKQSADRWYRFRADCILEYVRTVTDDVHKAKPQAIVGAFVLPWRQDEYEQGLYRIAGQDLEGFSTSVDVLSPMLYFHELGRPATWVSERVSELYQKLNVPILPIVQCFDLPKPIPPEDLRTALSQGQAAPSKGIILFSQKHLETTRRWQLIQEVLKK